MVNPDQYRLVRLAVERIRNMGFNLIAHSNSFSIVPARRAAMHVLPISWDKKFATLEETIAFCEGWYLMERQISKKCGFDLKEVKSRVEQQRVLNALKGKKTKTSTIV